MEAYVHMTGYVGGDVEYRNHTTPTGSFRLACTPRMRRGGDWTDGETTWLTVTCFRALAEHAASSIRRGDPLIVIGRLRTQVLDQRRRAAGEDGAGSVDHRARPDPRHIGVQPQ